MVKNNQDKVLNDTKLTNLDSITVNRNPTSRNEVENPKYVDDSIGHGTNLSISQTLENYLKVSVGNDTYNLTKYDQIQIIDTTNINQGNCAYLLTRWKVICNGRIFNGIQRILFGLQ